LPRSGGRTDKKKYFIPFYIIPYSIIHKGIKNRSNSYKYFIDIMNGGREVLRQPKSRLKV